MDIQVKNTNQLAQSPIYSQWLLNSEKAIRELKASTIQEAINSPSPILANIAMVHPEAAKKILIFLISDVVLFFNVGKTMNSAQVIQTADLILSDPETKNLKPDDFKICFQRAKSGIYGKIFDRVDGLIVFEWLRAYMAERMDLKEQMSIKEHSEFKKEPTDVNPEGQKKVLDILKSAVKSEDLQEEKKPAIQKSPRDLFIQHCFSEFYNLWLKKPYNPPRPKTLPGMTVTEGSGGRFILWDGEPVDEVEYTQIKLKEYDQNR